MTSNPSALVNISHLVDPLAEFETLYATGMISRDLNVLQSTISRMTELQEKIYRGIQSAPPSMTRYFNWGIMTQEKTAHPLHLEQEIQKKLAQMFQHYSEVERHSPSYPIAFPSFHPATPPSHDIKLIATGFGNLGANCWANSLLSMILAVPSLKEAYETVAQYYAKDNNPLNRLYGSFLLQALSEYTQALALKKSVPPQVTQNVRLAFNHFFGRMSATGEKLFSPSCFAHEDAYEAMQMLMGRYEEILKSLHQFPPALYCPLETKRFYRPDAEPRNADPEKLNKDAYSKLIADSYSLSTSYDYQILIDLQNKGHLSFPDLMVSFFSNFSTQGSDPATYLRSDGKIQNFILTSETRQFSRVPSELLVTIKRFGTTREGYGYKIPTPVSVSQMITLPQDATTKGEKIVYALDAFIAHLGGFGAGHYICYKKINNQWVEVDDGHVRFVCESEIDQILRGEKGVSLTSYIHHYSHVPQSPQSASNHFHDAASALFNLNALDVAKFNQDKQMHDVAIQHLEQLDYRLKKNEDPSAVLKTLESSAPDVINTLRYALWLQDKTPDIYDYGARVLQENPKRILDTHLPWLYPSCDKTLLGQILTIQRKKQAMITEKLYTAYLDMFLAKLNTPSVSDDELLKDLQEKFPEPLQWKLHELIYQSHSIKYGQEAIDRPEYGKTVLENGNIRKTLKEATERVLNLPGANIVEQLRTFHRMRAESLQFIYEKEQLQAFHYLLTYTTDLLSNQQLVKAFEKLDIRPHLKERLFWHIWYASHMPNIPDYGKKTFYNNPRGLLLIKDNLLASSPICLEKTDPLTQLIALLECVSHPFAI